MEIQAPKGTKDTLPQDVYKWHYVEGVLRDVSKSYGVREIRTPVFEHMELFLRDVGETTDIVQRGMYTFNDRGNKGITLKPEGTVPTIRVFIKNRLFNEAQPTKSYYMIPCFRYENTQKGRLRQFRQYEVEVFGSGETSIDTEVISLAMESLEKLGLKSSSLNINSLGCPECKPKHNEALKKYLEESYDNLCGICKTRLEKNPMRILGCKEKSCNEITRHAPTILDYICEECDSHSTEVKNYLDTLKIQYKVGPGIARELGYYTKTMFEILNDDLTVYGGGRYDKLIEEIGGPEMPAVGFGLGLGRLIVTLEKEGVEIPNEGVVDPYVGARGETAKISAFVLTNKLRAIGIKTEINHMGRSIKAEMRYANRIDSTFTIILGDNELQDKTLGLKRTSDGEQFEMSLDNIEEIAKPIK